MISVKLAAPIASTVTQKIHAKRAFQNLIFNVMDPVAKMVSFQTSPLEGNAKLATVTV